MTRRYIDLRMARVRADVFGNVNYAIVLQSYGISEESAVRASRMGTGTAGVSDTLDDRAISLGYQMAEKYPGGVPEGAYRDMILSELGSSERVP